jgi:hypothetical protein
LKLVDWKIILILKANCVKILGPWGDAGQLTQGEYKVKLPDGRVQVRPEVILYIVYKIEKRTVDQRNCRL